MREGTETSLCEKLCAQEQKDVHLQWYRLHLDIREWLASPSVITYGHIAQDFSVEGPRRRSIVSHE